ncbi:MAG: TerB family tellurite resistance protein [Nitrospinota bacterium]|nr:TerB family tellurite resistance protein [Nitrospinota bacterium]
MNWIGKVTLGALGFALRGPAGAVAGALAGAVIDAAPEALRVFFPEPTAQDADVAAYGLLGKVACCDGRINNDELRAFVEFLDRRDIEGAARADAGVMFKASEGSQYSLEQFAISFFRLVNYDDEKLLQMVEAMLHMATADGPVNQAEDRAVAAAARIFLVNKEDFDSIRNRFKTATGEERARSPKGSLAERYETLGANPADSDDTIKKRYRKLVADFHPDTIASKDLPEEFTKFANTKLSEINEAYDAIRKSRGMR